MEESGHQSSGVVSGVGGDVWRSFRMASARRSRSWRASWARSFWACARASVRASEMVSLGAEHASLGVVVFVFEGQEPAAAVVGRGHECDVAVIGVSWTTV